MKKILIIDDEKPTREFIRRMLESFKLNVAIFIDGENVETGIKAIEEIQPDLVLLDIQMPGLSGLEVLHHIRSDPRHQKTKVIAYTAYASSADVGSLIAKGFDAVLLKPIKSVDLIRTLSN